MTDPAEHIDNDVDLFLLLFGDRAYQEAVDITVAAVHRGDAWAAHLYAAIARELLQRDYHKRGSPPAPADPDEKG